MPSIILAGIGRRLLSAASDDGQELTLVIVEEAVHRPAIENCTSRVSMVVAQVV
jgi:hypothetical protein